MGRMLIAGAVVSLGACAVSWGGGPLPFFLNSGFETGLVLPWEVDNTAGGTGAKNAEVVLFDHDGGGPGTASLMLRVGAGRASAGTGLEGVTITQRTELGTGHGYILAVDWAVVGLTPGVDDPIGTTIELVRDSFVMSSVSTGPMSGGTHTFGTLFGWVFNSNSQTFDIGVRIRRGSVVSSSPDFVQYVDNIRLVPSPGAGALLGVAGLAGLRRRR